MGFIGGGRDTAHQGASRTMREVADWDVRQGSADADLLPEIGPLRDRARDLDRNNGMAQNIRRSKTDSIIGTGLQLSPKPRWRMLGWTSDQAHEWSLSTREAWQDYSTSPFFDADGELDFHQLTRLMYSSEFQSGDGCAIPMWKARPGSPFKTCIKVIESDRLSNPNEADDTATLAGGIERASDGEVRAYHVRNFHPGDAVNEPTLPAWERIQARDARGRRRFIHTYLKERPGQSRGKAAASACLALFGLQGKYQLTEAQATAVNARIAGILESNLSPEQAAEMFGGKREEYEKLRQGWTGQIPSGGIVTTPPGTEFKAFTPNRPATAYAAFMEQIAREIGASFGLPFEIATRNFSKTNYSSARAALLEAWRGFYVERARFALQWASACYELWLEEAVERGRIEAPGFYENRSAYCACRWLAPGQAPLDRKKDADADGIQLEQRTRSLLEIYEERGEDMEEGLEQTFREDAIKARLRIKHPLPVDPDAAPTPVPAETADETDSIEGEGEELEDDDKTAEQQAEERDAA